jgi:hypothetical protein
VSDAESASLDYDLHSLEEKHGASNVMPGVEEILGKKNPEIRRLYQLCRM